MSSQPRSARRTSPTRSALATALTVLALVLGTSSTRLGGQGPAAPPILLVVNSAAPNKFGPYLAEILRAEGIQSFSTVELSTLDAGVLGGAKLAVLAETSLSSAQATLFTDYVTGGGRLVAMKPDGQLASLFGISVLGPTTTNGYVAVDQSGPGAGLQAVTLPFRGVAANYALAGATQVAALYSTRTAAVGVPAVVTSGRTAAWSFDLARSTAYTRQGDPAFAGQERDGIPIIRPGDMFYGNIDLQRVGVPHADVQMRLFSRVIQSLLADSQPLPRLWYFPGTNRTMLVTTADSHVSTLANYTSLVSSAESHGARLSLYFSRFITMPAAAATWRSNGHELGLHPFMTPDGVDFPTGYQTAQNWFASTGLAPASPTLRNHAIEWLNWTGPLPTMVANNIRMDTSYYGVGPVMYNPTQQNQAHGYMTGSGLPMRFVASTGSLFPVYQQATQLIDEQLVFGDTAEDLSTSAALAVTQQLIDDSQNGGYSSITTQFHVDYYTFENEWVDGTMAYAQSLNVPMWTTQHWLTFNEARAATTFTNMTWSDLDKSLTFGVTVPVGAEAQTVLVPATFGGGALTSVLVGGQPVSTTALSVNGQSTRAVTITPAGGAARTVVVLYGSTAPSLSIADGSVTEGDSGSTATSLTVTLSVPTSNTVSVAYTTSNGTALAGSDYTTASGTVNFAPFQTSQTIPLSIVGDTNPESSEQFSVVLSNPTNASLSDSVGIVTIVDNDTVVPSLAIADATVAEGNGGTTTATFLVSLANGPGSTVTVSYATANGTATAGSDYTAGSGTLTFNPGVTQLPLNVTVQGDTTVEADETFTVTLSAPVNAVLADGQATGTITNDDVPSGPVNATFSVAAGADDVNEQGTTFTPDGSQVWVGSGATAATSYSGFRFSNVTIPAGATITSAKLDVQAASTQWLGVAFEFAVEASANSAAFSDVSRPSQRTLLAPRVAHLSDTQWVSGTRYQLDEIAPLLQAAIGQAGWAPGNALSLVLHGTGQSWARKFANAFENGAANAPRLVVTYTVGQPSQPTLSINDVTVTEGNAGSANATFTITLSAASAQTVTVAYATANGTATAGSDYTATSGTATFTPGATSQVVNVPVLGDTAAEANETFTVTLSSPTNATIADGSGAGTITNDDASSSLAINDVALAEGNAGSANATFTVTLSPASGQTVTVAYATANGTATAGSDYTATSGTLTFTPGVTTQAINVPVLGDTLDEPNETYTVTLSTPTNATIADGSGAGTITDDDPAPSFTINDVTVTEGNAGSANAAFTVTLSPASGQTVTVAYATSNGTATAGSDYTAASGTLTFNPGVTTQVVNVPVLGDTLDEANETYTVTLSGPGNATIADGSGAGTITDDDAAPSLTINDVTVVEGNAGTTNATFTVTLAPASGQTVTVAYATSNGTATAGSDYTAASGTLTFNPGVTTQSVVVPVLGDTTAEGNETYTVTLSAPTNATIIDGTGAGSITNDDGVSTLAINDVTVTEGNSGSTNATFTVTLSPASGQTVTVTYATSNGTATAGSDYTATSGTLSFTPGATTRTFTVAVSGDTLDEANETYTVTLASPTNATIADGTGIGTITDDDAAPTLAINDVAIAEGNAGSANATFTVTLSAASGQTVTVAYATSNGTATAGSDYTAVSGTLTFAPGVLTQPVPVPVLGDTAIEPSETFTVTLSGPTNASLLDGVGAGTITNDDAGGGPVTVTFPLVAGADDVVEDGASFTTDQSSVWLGNASTAATSYTGLRFAGVSIPAGATITSAYLEINAASTQWISLAFEFGAEAAATSAPFSTASRPSQRTLLGPRVNHSSNAQWVSGTWYALDSLTSVLQAVVSQPGWASGNAVGLVLHGTGQAWARKFARAFESGAATAPRLVVTYTP